MIQRTNDLATQALKSIENGRFGHPSKKRVSMGYPAATNMLSKNAKQSSTMKRSRSALSGSFDMVDFLKASEQVEETIAFPTIEWPSFDDESSDEENSYNVASSLTPSQDKDLVDDDEEDYGLNPRKRQCRGLIRCNRSCNLSSLGEISERSERRGSNGSLF